MEGVTRVPYHLPEMLRTIKDDGVIFVVEGEKDADRLRAFLDPHRKKQGFTATTNPGGAGKWRDEYNQWFKGAGKVYIIPDNDQPGRDHAQQVAQALSTVVDLVKVIELPGLPAKGDVSDWFDEDGGLVALRELIDETGVWVPARHSGEGGTVAELLGETLEPIRWIVNEVIPEGLTFLAGKTKIGKSWLTFLIADRKSVV